MTMPFVTQLRTRGDAVQLAAPGTPAITVRVEMPEVWDTIKVVVSLQSLVASLKARALEALYPVGANPHEFVLKLNGWQVLDESATLAAAGAKAGSIFLLTHRRRRAVR